jgi:hypothetical protein
MHFYDRPLTIQELDNALNKLNVKSAGGLDGIPTQFIKKFWLFLRQPLLKYAHHAFGTSTLSQSFNSAGIKLIPKKGDLTKIKNWRPISLLNVIFKIISKAIDTRLQKITEIVLSRGQKGFTNKRQLHECIINISETIAFAENEKIPSFLLALDMAKAFDTVRHDYMSHVYKFFGFGNNLINMLNVISTGRTAVIIKDDGSTSPPIRLGTGFPQGNSPSPNQFNIGEQILIFKIELDPRIKSIRNGPLDRPLAMPGGGGAGPVSAVHRPPTVRTYGASEMGRVTDKTEAFADDNNILARLDNLTLQAIKEILNNFAILSGLRCNVDKSQILLMGVNEIPNYVTESGFTVSDGIKILGFNITKLPLDCINNFDPAVEKIKQLITFWNRFRLSLPGRINVAKTLMLSQIGFYSAILDVPDEKIQEVQKLLDNFVLGQIKFDKKLITAPPSAGGLGMISVSNYIAALHCSWVKKAFASQIDNWRHDLYSMAGENINMVSPRLVGMQERVQLPVPAPVRGPVPVDANIRQPLPVQSPNKHPVLKSLSESFTKFKNAFYTIGRNFFLSRLGENPRLINNRREKIPVVLSEIFPNLGLDTIKKIELTKIEQLTKDGTNFESYKNFCATIDINITVNNFASLKNIVKDSWMAIKKISESENSIELETFVSRFKK